jgi:peptidoglycan hydrolase-like protein with peptidoglycan-binding domain
MRSATMMRRRLMHVVGGLLLVAGCHAHEVQNKQTTLEAPPQEPQVESARPVRTTPGGMLDPKSMHQIQAALSRHGVSAPSSGQMDDETQAAIRKFQKKQHIAETGMPDFGTLRQLGLDPKSIYVGGAKRASRNTPSPKRDDSARP